MWKPIDTAPKDGTVVWVGNTTTGDMRLARWGKFPLSDLDEGWLDVIISDTINLSKVRFVPNCYADIPNKPGTTP